MVFVGLHWSPVLASGSQLYLLVSLCCLWSLVQCSSVFCFSVVSSGLQLSSIVSAGPQWSFLVVSDVCKSPLVSDSHCQWVKSWIWWSLVVFIDLQWSLPVFTGLCWFLCLRGVCRSLPVSSSSSCSVHWLQYTFRVPQWFFSGLQWFLPVSSVLQWFLLVSSGFCQSQEVCSLV